MTKSELNSAKLKGLSRQMMSYCVHCFVIAAIYSIKLLYNNVQESSSVMKYDPYQLNFSAQYELVWLTGFISDHPAKLRLVCQLIDYNTVR